MLRYRGYLVVPGRHADTGVGHFSVRRADAGDGDSGLVHSDVLDGHFATDDAATEAAYEAAKKYIDELHAWGRSDRKEGSHPKG